MILIYIGDNIITGDYRNWAKKKTFLKYKNEMLNCEALEDLFWRNYKQEYDWMKTLNFIINRDEIKKSITNSTDTRERAYKIKNFIKELPTYAVLFKRNVNGIESEICPRCNKYEENWNHIWICENNKTSIREAIEDALINYEERMERRGENDTVKVINKIAKKFIGFLQEESNILLNKTKEWELIRGVLNENLIKLSNGKEEKEIIWELWRESYKETKKIWVERCNEVEQLEKDKGIMKRDKRKFNNGKKIETKEKTKENIEITKKNKTRK